MGIVVSSVLQVVGSGGLGAEELLPNHNSRF
jgi:hypothetical protein